ncbi:hypothetical protein CY35_04G055200 [Sphagnum magellanicum]|nr:hypothetical protein CY35_04G055200 [Sphagnum magellanicum]
MKKDEGKEVEYKVKSGTAWSHSYLNQKPWHPLSYPNQRRKWIAEQQNAQRDRKAEEVSREFAQEQEFFRQTAEMSKREKAKVEAMQAVGFMYMRPPGYNAESARAAEIADERRKLGLDVPAAPSQNVSLSVAPEGDVHEGGPGREAEGRKKPRAKDVFGRTLPTEEEFPALKDAPKLETGVTGRVKPFAIEIRNVKCARCGAFGHQSGDRECSLKDVIMPNEEERLKRNDPLTVIMAQASDEPFQWELKRQPGAMSPARGGFRPDDPNQQILADEDIYDEYGGFLAGVGGEEGEEGKLPDVLALLTKAQRKELAGLRKDEKRWKKKDLKRKHKHNHSSESDTSDSSVRIKHSGNKVKSKKRHKVKSKDTSGTPPRSHRRREERRSKSDLDASSAEADGSSKHKKHATNGSQIESLVESTRSKRADRSSDVDRSWQKDKRKPDGDVERFERHREIRHTHDNAREQQRQRH